MAGVSTDSAQPRRNASSETLPTTIAVATTLADGGVWTAADLTVLAPLAVAATPSSGTPTTLGVTGEIALGEGGSTGVLDLGGGSAVTAAALALGTGSGVTLLDGYSGVVLGDGGPMQGGAVVIGSGALLSGTDGSVVGSMVLDGALAVGAGGTLMLNGVLSGDGTAAVSSGADLVAVSAPTFTGSVALAPGATLTLEFQDAPQATLAMDQATVDLQGIAWGNGLAVTYDATSGLLTLGSATLDVGAGAAARDFAVTSDGTGGTLLTEQHDRIWQANAAGAGGDWTDPTHWIGGAVPQATETVEIGPGVAPATPWTVGVTDSATAEQLTLALGGDGTLRIGGSLDLGGGAASAAGGIAIGAGGVLAASAGVIAGNLTMQGGTAVLTGGAMTLDGSLSGFGAVTLDGAVLGAAAGFGGTLTIAGTVTLDAGSAPAGLVQFGQQTGAQAALDLRGVGWRSGATPGYDAATGVLTAGGATLDIGTGQSASDFAATEDAAGGTLVTTRTPVTTSGTGNLPGSAAGNGSGNLVNSGGGAGNATPPACFAAGSAILTPAGPVQVEQLAVGDLVVTRAYPNRPAAAVRWIGRCRVDPAAHPLPDAVRPVRIRRGAVAPGVPARDLRLSPDHAVALGGVLIPVKYLVNGTTVSRDRGLAPVVYYHIELDRHDIVLAEALPAETYLDTGNRAAFGATTVMPPRTWEADACATLMGDGPVVAAVRAHLAARAALLNRRDARAPSVRAAPALRSRASQSAAPPAV